MGVKITPREIDDLIKRNGLNCFWNRAQRCACISDEGYPSSLCPICQGMGWMRENPPRYLRGLLSGYSRRGQKTDAGQVDTGERQFTPPRNVRMAEGDFLTVMQFHRRDSEVLTYGAGTIDEEHLNALHPLQIERIRSIRDGAAYTFDPSLYTQDDKSTVDLTGAVLWRSDADPAKLPHAGERISVMYSYLDVYQVHRNDKPQTRGAQDMRLPDRVPLKLVTRRMLRGVGGTSPMDAFYER